MDMDLKDKLDYIGIVSNRILNYVNNDPEVADFMLKNKIVTTDKETGLSVVIALNKNME
jgi:hypothetical protein